MENQPKTDNHGLMRCIFVLYFLFGLIVDSLWLFDFIKYGKKFYSVIGVIILILGNSFQSFLTFHSLIKNKLIKPLKLIFYLCFLICGISVYVSTYGSEGHFSIFTVASIISQILYALYGITLIMGRNQKHKEIAIQSQLEDAPASEVQNSSCFFYNPEIPDDSTNLYNNIENDNSLSDSDYELKEKKKNFVSDIKKDESIEDINKIHHFTYPEQIDVSDSSIVGVVDMTNPYSLQDLELYGASLQV